MALVGGVFGGVNTAAFQQLQAFLAVARHRSFSGAARELGVTRSAVSQAVRQLEEQLRVVLLARTTRSVSLTDAGRRLLDGAGPALGQALATMTEVSAQPGEAVGRVRLSVPRPAVPFVIDPVLPAFRARHPRIEVEVTIEDRLVDIVAEGYDAGVRLTDVIERDMVQVRLTGPFRFVVVGAEAYLARRGTPERPKTSCAMTASRSARRPPGRSTRGNWSAGAGPAACRFAEVSSPTTVCSAFRSRSVGADSLTPSSRW